MSIIANNCYRYNYEMEFWLMKDYTAGDLLDNWNEIYEYAIGEDSEDNAYFLADCMDVLYEKVLTLTDSDKVRVLDKANRDMETYERRHKLALGRVATFDCRMVPLPTIERVQDYFRWRQEDANKNALNSHCYWMLRKEGQSVHEATKELEGKGVSFKNELLFTRGINYDKLPSWQKRGIGMWNEQYEKEGYNPMTKETVAAVRSRIHVEYELPLGDAYAEMVAGFVKGYEATTN